MDDYKSKRTLAMASVKDLVYRVLGKTPKAKVTPAESPEVEVNEEPVSSQTKKPRKSRKA